MNFGDAGEGFGLLDTEMDDYIQYSLMAGATASAGSSRRLASGSAGKRRHVHHRPRGEGERRRHRRHPDQPGRCGRSRSHHVAALPPSLRARCRPSSPSAPSTCCARRASPPSAPSGARWASAGGYVSHRLYDHLRVVRGIDVLPVRLATGEDRLTWIGRAIAFWLVCCSRFSARMPTSTRRRMKVAGGEFSRGSVAQAKEAFA